MKGATLLARDTVQVTVIDGDLTAHRPLHEGGDYAPFAKTDVEEVDEESTTLGPGIRINGDSDDGNGTADRLEAGPIAGENDLIEVLLTRDPTDRDFRLRRNSDKIKVWTSKTKGTAIPFPNENGLETDDLPFAAGASELSVWAEWADTGHGTADLQIKDTEYNIVMDTIKFHTFQNVTIVLGGEGQTPVPPTPGNPLDPNYGMFHIATDLYEEGYDMHMYNEDDVWWTPLGKGPAFDEIVNGVTNRGVTSVAIMGYSHGGGSTRDLAWRIQEEKKLGNLLAGATCALVYTAYVDAVNQETAGAENESPPGSNWHLNLYQSGALSGGPVQDFNEQYNVDTHPSWRLNVTHTTIDNHKKVKDWVKMRFRQNVDPR